MEDCVLHHKIPGKPRFPTAEEYEESLQQLLNAVNAKRSNMHYKNGREAKNGDKVVLIDAYGNAAIGILYDAKAGNDFCNGKLASISPSDPCPNLKECLHLDDVKTLLTPMVGYSDKK
jgi:hypothetical protein